MLTFYLMSGYDREPVQYELINTRVQTFND